MKLPATSRPPLALRPSTSSGGSAIPPLDLSSVEGRAHRNAATDPSKTVVLQVPRSFLRYYDISAATMEVQGPEDSTILDLIRLADLPEVEFGIAAVNGERQHLTYRPKDGDVVELHPILMGG